MDVEPVQSGEDVAEQRHHAEVAGNQEKLPRTAALHIWCDVIHEKRTGTPAPFIAII